MSVLHITCKHWLGHVTVNKRAGDSTLVRFIDSEIDRDITLILPVGLYYVEQSQVAGRTAQTYSVIVGADSVVTLEIAWQNANIATLADQQKVQYDGVSAGLHYAFGIKHGNCFLGDVRQDLPLLDSIVLGTDVPFILLSGVVGANGDTLELIFSKDAYRGTSFTPTAFNIDTVHEQDIQLTYISGEGTTTLVFAINTIVQANIIVSFDFSGLPDVLVDGIGISLDAIDAFAITNNSQEEFTDIIIWSGFDGNITGASYTATPDDYPHSHTTAVIGSPVLHSTIKMVGWSSLHRPFGIHGLVYDIPANVPIRIGAWHYATTEYAQHPFRLRSSVQATIDLRFTIYYGTRLRLQSYLIPTPVDHTENFAANTWRFFEFVFDPANRKIAILINGVVKIDYTHSSEFPTANPINRLYLAEYNTYGPIDFNDNLIVSTDIARDLYALSFFDGCPRI